MHLPHDHASTIISSTYLREEKNAKVAGMPVAIGVVEFKSHLERKD